MIYNVNGSNINKVEWADREMFLFYNDGLVVKYLNVPQGIAVGVSTAPSVGSYINQFVRGEFEYVVTQQSDISHLAKKLMHHKDSTVGLWATDRPDLIPAEIKDLFFEIKYTEDI